jgi:hypothetical protein
LNHILRAPPPFTAGGERITGRDFSNVENGVSGHSCPGSTKVPFKISYTSVPGRVLSDYLLEGKGVGFMDCVY